jgi:hypothetical protein
MFRWVFAVVLVLGSSFSFASEPTACVPAEEASKYLNKDICIAAHVYEVVELPDGKRFLDTCSAEVSDAQCRFTIVSLPEDREQVGELNRYRDQDVHVRGIVRSVHGRAAIVLSHARQFSGGPPKFRPNPLLQRGFTGEDERPPIHDPNLRSQGAHRGFMNTREQESPMQKTDQQK